MRADQAGTLALWRWRAYPSWIGASFPIIRHSRQIAAVATLALLMLVLVELHVHGVNGPWYGVVTWRRYPAAMTYGLMLLSALPTLIGAALWERIEKFRIALLILPMLGAMACKLVFAELRGEPEHHLSFIRMAVKHPLATSYYSDATALSNFRGWLAGFPDMMHLLSLHSQTKAPGMILYYMAFIKSLGDSDRTAMIAGLVLGAIATCAIPLTYVFLRVLLEDERPAFFGACFLSLCPGFALFFPVSDPAFVNISCLLGICWMLAVKRDDFRWTIAFGATGAFMLLISFSTMLFGLFLAGWTLFVADRTPRLILRHATIAAVVCAAICGVMWLATGYDPIATFQSAWKNQHALLAQHASERPYPATIWNDLLDFALGSGWISFLLAGFCVAWSLRRGWSDRITRIVLICAAVPIFVAVTALLASETARVWNFLLPLLMVPVGIGLASYRPAERIVVLSCLAIVLAAICRNMSIFM